MTDSRPPCADPANDPQDWFISANGKQYSFEDLLTKDERHRVSKSVLPRAGETPDEHEERCQLALNAAREGRKNLALRRRQAAKSKCFTQCRMREACGRGAIERGEMHGTWGGFFEEELAQVITLDRRRRGLSIIT